MVDVVLIGESSSLLHDTALGIQHGGFTVLVVPPGDDEAVRELRPQLIIDTTESSPSGVVVFERTELDIDVPDVASEASAALSAAIIDMMSSVRRPTLRGKTVTVGDITLDLAGVVCTVDEQAVELTSTEFRLLAYLVENVDVVVSKEQILERVFDFDGYQPNVVEVHISALRRKIDAGAPRRIETVRGLGYVIRSPKNSPVHRQPRAS